MEPPKELEYITIESSDDSDTETSSSSVQLLEHVNSNSSNNETTHLSISSVQQNLDSTEVLQQFSALIGLDESNNRNATNQICEYCGLISSSWMAHIRHLRIHTIMQFECSLCTSRAKNAVNRNKHEHRCHRLKRPIEWEELKEKLTATQLSIVESTNGPTLTRFTCVSCNIAFSSHSFLSYHDNFNHLPRMFSCTFCPKKFPVHSVRNKHKQTHNYVRPDKYRTTTKGVPLDERYVQGNPITLSRRGRPRKSASDSRMPNQLSFNALNSTNRIPVDISTASRNVEIETHQPLTMQINRTPINALTPEQLPAQSSVESPSFDLSKMVECLRLNPLLIYYDVNALSGQFGTLFIDHWTQQPDCRLLMLRVNGKRYDGDANLGEPIWSTSVPRYELNRKMNRDSHVVCFAKPEAVGLMARAAQKINPHMSFVELIDCMVPALKLPTSLIVASDHDRRLLDSIDLKSKGIFVP